MKGRTAALVMALFLLLYVVLVAQRAYLFVMTGEPIAVVLGVALLVLPVLGIFALVAELRFDDLDEARALARALRKRRR